MLNDLNNLFLSLKDQFVELLPNILLSLVVLGLGYLFAKMVKYLIKKAILYIGKLISLNYKTVDLSKAASFIGIAFFWLIIFSTVLMITDILGLTIITQWFEEILKYIPNVLAAIMIIFAAIVIGNFISSAIVSFASRVGISHGLTLGKIAQYFILFTAIVIAIDQIGIEISFLINIVIIILAAMLFSAGLAFGLGAKTSISNILAAFYIRKSYQEGDVIQIGTVRGTIIKIDSRSVILENEEGQVNIPAKEFNETRSILISKP